MKDNKPHKLDIIPITIYFLCLFILLFGYYFSLLNQHHLNQLILLMNIAFPLFLFTNYYKRLRIGKLFIVWFFIGIVHFASTFPLSKFDDFNSFRGSYASGYDFIVVTLTIYFVLRLISAFIFRQDFIPTAWYSPDDFRKKNTVDYILTFLGVGLFALYNLVF